MSTQPPLQRQTSPHIQAPEIRADYATAGLLLKRPSRRLGTPNAQPLRVTSAIDIWKKRKGRFISVAGIVTSRQRPGTAKGIVFETLEDETGITNLILKPEVYERYRASARSASMIQTDGYIERVGKVEHIIASRLHDLSAVLEECELKTRNFH